MEGRNERKVDGVVNQGRKSEDKRVAAVRFFGGKRRRSELERRKSSARLSAGLARGSSRRAIIKHRVTCVGRAAQASLGVRVPFFSFFARARHECTRTARREDFYG